MDCRTFLDILLLGPVRFWVRNYRPSTREREDHSIVSRILWDTKDTSAFRNWCLSLNLILELAHFLMCLALLRIPLGIWHEYGTPEYDELCPAAERLPGSRAVIVVSVHKVGTVSSIRFHYLHSSFTNCLLPPSVICFYSLVDMVRLHLWLWRLIDFNGFSLRLFN